MPETPFTIVLDTNLLVRLVLSRTEQSRAVFDDWRAGRFRVVASQAILSELRRVLHYPRIQQTFHLSDDDIASAWEGIRRRVFLVEGLYEVFRRKGRQRQYLSGLRGGGWRRLSGESRPSLARLVTITARRSLAGLNCSICWICDGAPMEKLGVSASLRLGVKSDMRRPV